jgi:hypothetical protein
LWMCGGLGRCKDAATRTGAGIGTGRRTETVAGVRTGAGGCGRPGAAAAAPQNPHDPTAAVTTASAAHAPMRFPLGVLTRSSSAPRGATRPRARTVPRKE